MSQPVGNLSDVLCGLDLDGVLCDLGPPVAARIARRFGVATHPSAWTRYDLRTLDLGVARGPFHGSSGRNWLFSRSACWSCSRGTPAST